MLTDHRDAPVTGATPAALDRFETAIAQFNCYRDDPVATLDEAIAESPDFAMAQIAKALPARRRDREGPRARRPPASRSACASCR